MARTDIHRPAVVITEDYDFFGCGDYGTSEEPGFSPLISPQGQALLNEGWRFADVESNGCQHCGARLRFYALLLHAETRTFLRVGETCLDNRFSLATSEFHRLRKAAELNRDRMARTAKRELFLSDPRNAEAIEFAEAIVAEYNAAYPDAYDMRWASFPADLLEKFSRDGQLSERQVDALLAQAERRAAKLRERRVEAERFPAAPVVEGRQVITGEVLKTDVKDDGYNLREVMTIRDDRGMKLWGSVPSAINVSKGDRVTFTATVTVSDNDETFGFFKRPTKAEVL
jgi:hypothetical protein